MIKDQKPSFKFYEFAYDSVANRNHIKEANFRENLFTKTECYQSLYAFDDSIINYLSPGADNINTSIAGIEIPVWANEVVIDIDFKDEQGIGDIPRAQNETKKLLHHLESNHEINLNDIEVEFSGGKGFHIRIPAALFGGFEPSINLPDIHKQIVINLTNGFEGIDTSIYNRNRLMRIPNTKHGKSNLYAIPLKYNQLFSLTADEIKAMAKQPLLTYSFTVYDELATNNSLQEIKELSVQAVKNMRVKTQDEATKQSELDISSWTSIEKNCKVVSKIVDKGKSKENITNTERFFLATLATQFGRKGELKLHEILGNQSNYDATKTETQITNIKEKNYKPMLCSSICDRKCSAIEAISKESPIAFAFLHKDNFKQSKALSEFAKLFQDKLLFIPSLKSFYYYEKGVYREIDEYNLGRIVNNFLMLNFDENSISEYGISSFIKRLKVSDQFIYNNTLNPDPLVINLSNGMYDLRTGRFFEHSLSYKSSVQLNVAYNPTAECKVFEEKLNEIFDGDEDKIDYYLQWMLYCLLPTYQHQKFLIMHGTGRNGKGVLINVLVDILGKQNCSFETFSDLAADKNYSLVNLMDKYVNISSELSSKESETDIIKRLTGGDFLSTREIYKGKIQFKNFAKLIVLTNGIPRVTNLDKAFLNRVEILEFTRSFEDNPDTQLTAKLKTELSGILNLFLSKKGKLLRENGEIKLAIPESLKDNQKKYKSSFHSVSEFIEDECETLTAVEEDLNIGIRLKHLYDLYRDWCINESGYKPVGKKVFRETLETTTDVVIAKIPYVKTRYLDEEPDKNQIWVLGISAGNYPLKHIVYHKDITKQYRQDKNLNLSIDENDWIYDRSTKANVKVSN